MSYTYCNNNDFSLHLLGNLFDYKDTNATNELLLKSLLKYTNKESFFKALDQYFGEYVLIYSKKDELLLLNDCCAQYEIYYKEDHSQYASQIGLLVDDATSISKNHKYYNTTLFENKKLCIGDSTPYPTIKHLLPNHYIDNVSKQVIRFFPNHRIAPISLEIAAQKAAQMLRGYIKSISSRHKIVLPVTGGFDSRLLFLASLDTSCDYFVSQHVHIPDTHYDLWIPKKITALFKKKLKIIKDSEENSIFLSSTSNIDYPRNSSFPKLALNKILINGNISEIARNYYNYHTPVTSKKIALLNGYSDNPFVIEVYQKWLDDNQNIFEVNNFNTLDLFYWEEKMGNWAAKAKTEAHAMGIELMSPFNSRGLLQILLATNRKDRDKFDSKLYIKIIENLVANHKEVNVIPTNPDFERKRALFLKRFGLFTFFDATRLQLRLLKRKLKKLF